ncbi:MAG: hypothetical protein HY904_17025 [Deltaproteobacteria bacterium]|nr:hypothetical protein [Deltaproteobacteria bacterium]
MRRLLLPLLAVAAGCSAFDRNPCSITGGEPDVPSGTLQANRDGTTYVANTGLRGYRLQNDRTNIEAGDITLQIGKDKDGNNVQDLIDRNKFPICILLDDQSDGTTYAQVRAGGVSYGTDSSHTGTVALTGKAGDELLGRFELEAVQNSGSGTTRLEDGQFRLGPR